MYRKFYGLEKKPFDLTPDGNIIYLSEAHREGIATLRYGVIADKGFLMLTGGVGTGKTTIINTLLPMLRDKVRVCLLNNPKLNKHEFFHYLAKKLRIRFSGNKSAFILEFSKLLEQCEKRGEKILLIIDEAQVFPVELMEEVRLLSNHAGERNVLSIFLIGQPELQETLANPRLLPLRQRIGLHYHLPELTRKDTAQYISYRLNMAGAANAALFTSDAIDMIHRASRGTPRLVNVICDHALISGFNLELNQIDREVVLKCIEEIRLPRESKLTLPDVATSAGKVAIEKKAIRTRKQRRGSAVAVLVIGCLAVLAGVLYYCIDRGWIDLGLQ